MTLTGVELFSGTTGADGTFTRLARLTPGQAALVARYAPQAGGTTAGTTPFVDVAGQLVAVTSGFSPALLAGQSQAQIAGVVAKPDDRVGPGGDGRPAHRAGGHRRGQPAVGRHLCGHRAAALGGVPVEGGPGRGRGPRTAGPRGVLPGLTRQG